MAEGGQGGGEAEDRTEAPSQRRLDRARDEGQVPLSREAVTLAGLLGGTLAAMVALPTLGDSLLRAMRGVLAGAHALDPMGVAVELARGGLLAVLPVAGGVAVAAVVATMLQTGGLVSAKGLAPKLSKLNPAAGLKRLFGLDSGVEFLRTLLKLGIVGAVLWRALGDGAALQAALHRPAGGLLAEAGGAALRLAGAALGALALIAVLDVVWVRLRHLRRLRMSLQDLKEEAKDTDGDPHVKARQRQIRRQRAGRRMLAAVPEAAVVITNPTHYAVALAYERDASGRASGAPRVVAKGVDSMAARIRAAAEAAGVPLVPNPPLARALHTLELDAEIPPEHYQAVAEIIAFVWRLRGRAAAVREEDPG